MKRLAVILAVSLLALPLLGHEVSFDTHSHDKTIAGQELKQR